MDSKNLIEPKIEPKEEVARSSAPQLGSKMEKQTPGMRQSLLAAKELAAQLEKTFFFSEGEDVEEHERNDGWQGVNRQGKAPRERRYFPLGGKCDVAKVLWEFAKSRSSRRAGEKHSGPTQGAG